eukprot:2827007-Rhodomonas_salina.1
MAVSDVSDVADVADGRVELTWRWARRRRWRREPSCLKRACDSASASAASTCSPSEPLVEIE